MKPRLLPVTALFTLVLSACRATDQASTLPVEKPFAIGAVQLENMMQEKQTFILIWHRPTCRYCSLSLPIFEALAAERWAQDTSPLLFTVDTAEVREEIDEWFQVLLPAIAETDISYINKKLYVPQISSFKEGQPVFSKTGLPKEKRGAEKLLTQLLAGLENDSNIG